MSEIRGLRMSKFSIAHLNATGLGRGQSLRGHGRDQGEVGSNSSEAGSTTEDD